MGNLLGALQTGLGDIAHNVLDSFLPKELNFVGGAVGGILDLETGNLVGAAKNLIDSVLDLKDLAQTHKPPGGPANAPGSNQCWNHEPTPPPAWRASPPPPPRTTATAPTQTDGVSKALTAAIGKVVNGGAHPAAGTTDSTAVAKTDPASLSKSSFLALSDDALMSAIRDGKIPKEVAESKDGMLAIQARMNDITQMNQLMTSMLQAIHQMRMGVVQNLRV